MIVYFSNEKGGSGKTTTLLHISLYLKFYLEELETYIVDSDIKQKAIKKVMIKRVQNNLMNIDIIKDEKVNDIIKKDIANGLILVDGRGNTQKEDNKFLEYCDLVIVPCGVTFLDIESTLEYITFLKNNEIKYKVLFTKVDDKEKLQRAIKIIGSENCFDSYLPLNDKYSEIFEDGKTALDESFVNVYKWKMKQQVGSVVAEMLETLGYEF